MWICVTYERNRRPKFDRFDAIKRAVFNVLKFTRKTCPGGREPREQCARIGIKRHLNSRSRFGHTRGLCERIFLNFFPSQMIGGNLFNNYLYALQDL